MSTLGFGLGAATSNLGIVGTSSVSQGHYALMSETIGVAQTSFAGTGLVLSELLGTNDHVVETYRQLVVMSETIGAGSTLTPAQGVVLTEQLRLLEDVTGNGAYQLLLADVLYIAEATRVGQPATLSETIGMAPVLQAAMAVTVLEGLGIAPEQLGVARYGMSLAQTIGVAESIRNFFGLGVAETIGVAETQSAAMRSVQTLSETVGLAGTLTPSLVLRVEISESLDVTPELAIGMIYSAELSEGIELSAAFLSPEGSFTTWAMNTRSAAVTEYDNFEFNSFAQMGQRYLGASAAGLFELDGADDAGDDIIARLKGGYLQFAGAHLARLKAAYLAARGEGDFVLRIETGQGETYDYAVSTRNVRSTKVHMGKGQRARYFAYELISTGQDFDLDTLEFVPIVLQRRV